MDELSLSFGAAVGMDGDERVAVLGGKGAALARMVALGLPAPPGFTLTTAACQQCLEQGWSDDLEAAVTEGIGELEDASGKRLGDPTMPLLVSVRSGAPVSMPGMMDTVLNACATGDRPGGAVRRG